jgi:hypothetical protein
MITVMKLFVLQNIEKFTSCFTVGGIVEARGSAVVKALYYKPESCGFETL